MAPILTALCTVVFVALCCAGDLRTRRIPNWLTLPALVLGLTLHVVLLGLPGLVASLSGVAVVTALLLPSFALGGIGGGDVKMMAAVGALLGPGPAVISLMTGMVLGGIVMLVHVARLGRLGQTLGSLVGMAAGALRTRSVAPLQAPAARADAVTLPYSVPLGLATVTVVAIGVLSR